MGMLSALEELDEVVAPEAGEGNGDEKEFEEAMLAVMEAENDLNEENNDIKDMDDAMDDVDSSVERLEGLKATIQQYGISGPMMMAADPGRELVAAGICVAYEELEETPVKDENAEVVVEGIKETMKNIWKKIVDAFKWLANKIKSWFTRVVQMFTSYEKATVAAIIKLKKTTIDESKLKDIEVKAYSATDAETIGKSMKTALSTLQNLMLFKAQNDVNHLLNNTSGVPNADSIKKATDAINAGAAKWDIKELGLEVRDEKDGDKTIITKKPSITPESRKMTDLGYKKDDVLKVLKESNTLARDTKAIDKIMKELGKQYTDSSSTVAKNISALTSMDDAAVSVRNKAIGELKRSLRMSHTVTTACVSASARLASSSLAAYRGIMKAA